MSPADRAVVERLLGIANSYDHGIQPTVRDATREAAALIERLAGDAERLNKVLVLREAHNADIDTNDANQAESYDALQVAIAGAAMRKGRGMKYSIQELDEMRQIIAKRLIDESISGLGVKEWNKRTEELLRTYIMNGTTLEELRNPLLRKHGLITNPAQEVKP